MIVNCVGSDETHREREGGTLDRGKLTLYFHASERSKVHVAKLNVNPVMVKPEC